MTAIAGPYREASAPPKSNLEVAIEAAADRIDCLLRKSLAPFLTKGEHERLQRDLEDARREHQDLVHRFEDAELHRRLISARARAIVYHARKVSEFASPPRSPDDMIQDRQARARVLRAYVDGLERMNIFVDPSNLATLDGSDVTCVECVSRWLDSSMVACAAHPPRRSRS